MTAPDRLLWLDLETTGVDETRDSIIEIGAILTDQHLEEISAISAIHMVVAPSDEGLGRLLRNPVVRAMHEANGLLPALIDESHPTIREVQSSVLGWLNRHGIGRDDKVVLAGSGVAHFDRRFIRAHMPRLDRRLHHWCIDVGVIRRAHHMWATTPPPDDNTRKTHRALDDARCHLDEARAYRALWSA